MIRLVGGTSVFSGKRNTRTGVEQLRSTLTKIHLIGLARFVHQTLRHLFVTSVETLRKLTRIPLIGTQLAPLLAGIDKSDHFYFDMTELINVSGALSDEHLPYWVSGGWGIDVLAGSQTRQHYDLDIALDCFNENLSSAAAVFTRLGYRRKAPLGGIFWFPKAEVFEDDRGHHIEVHSVDWDLMSAAQRLLDPLNAPHLEPNASPDTSTPRLLELCTTTASIEGVKIPTFSVAAQRLFHQGYAPGQQNWQADDVIDVISTANDVWVNPLRKVAPAEMKPEAHKPSTLLLVPVFSFPRELWRLCKVYHNDLSIIPPHVTLAFPFLPLESITPEIVETLTQFFNETPSFDFELNQIRWFSNDVVYLEPSKGDTFSGIIETLQRMFPDFHPYDGQFELVIPHLCLSEQGSLSDRRALARRAAEFLPVSSHATHVWMMSDKNGPDAWSIARIFYLEPTSTLGNRSTH